MASIHAIPDQYVASTRGKTTLIIKKGFEDILKDVEWETPEELLLKYASADIAHGRGTVAVIPCARRKVFMKKMLHGGFFGPILGDAFSADRVVDNLRYSSILKAKGIPSPEAVFVILKKKGSHFFEGYIGEELIEEAENLIQIFRRKISEEVRRELLRRTASLLNHFHNEGFYHRDLNAGNVIIKMAPDKLHELLFFIDLDRMRKNERIGNLKRLENIFRLFRSFRKSVGSERFSEKDEDAFLEYYCSSDPRRLSAFRILIPFYRFSFLFHRLAWTVFGRR
ncbi:MAG: lipopolysaccharide kinase InaA family protein [Acidobacteriota bacterium]